MRTIPSHMPQTIIVIALSFLLTACGTDENSPDDSSQTFWQTYDLGDNEYFTSLANGPGGSIVVGGLAQVEVEDSAGSSSKSYSSNQATLVKIQPGGDIEWTAVFGNETYSESVSALTQDLSGGYLAVVRQSYIGGPGTDFTVQQVSGDGVLGSATQSNEDQWDDMYDIRPCSDGNFILAGRRANMGHWMDRANIMKVDPSGAAIWHKNFTYPNANLTARRIVELNDNTLLAASGLLHGDGSGKDLNVLRLSAAGDSLYSVAVPFDGAIEVNDIAATSDGGYKVLLEMQDDQYACAIVRMTNLGAVSSIQYTFPNTSFIFSDGQFTPDGGAILCGYFQTDPSVFAGILVKLDATGVITWEREFVDPNASVSFEKVINYSDGGYVMAGVRGLILDGSRESLLVRSDEDGHVDGAP